MPTNTKNLSLSIDKNLLGEFNALCKKEAVNKTKIVSLWMRKWIEKKISTRETNDVIQ